MPQRNFPEVFTTSAGSVLGTKVIRKVEELAWDDPVDTGLWRLKFGPLTLTRHEERGRTVTSDLEVVDARIVTTEIRLRR